MQNQDMDFLDPGRGIGRDAQFDIVFAHLAADGAATAPGQGNHPHFSGLCRLDGLHDIGGVAAGADREQDITLLP